MLTDAQLAFVDSVGRYFARSYKIAPVNGRVVGWLLICDPPRPTAAEIAEQLGVSRSAVGNAVALLETWNVVERTRPPGERADRIGLRAGFGVESLEASAEYVALAQLARSGLELLGDAPPSVRARLAETAAFADFLVERMPQVAREWVEYRDRLRASGELPSAD